MTGRIPTEQEAIGYTDSLRPRDTIGSPANPIAIF